MRGAVISTSVHKGFPTTFTLGRGIQFHASCIQGRPCGSWRTRKRFVIMKKLRCHLSICLIICSTVAFAQSANTIPESIEKDTNPVFYTWTGLRVSYKPIILDYSEGHNDLTGFSAECVFSFNLSDNVPLFLECGFGYQYATYEENEKGIKAELVLHTSYAPFNIGYKYHFDKKNAIIPFIGLILRRNIVGEITLSENYYGEKYDLDVFDDDDMEDEAWNRFQIGWQIGIGLNINKFYAGISCGSDFNELYEDAKFKTASITLGFNF